MAKTPQIILIDGPAGSGKTTLALELKAELECQVVHLDDHYNGWDEALGADLTATLVKIVTSFVEGKPSEVSIFNWHKMEFEGSRTISPGDTLIVEGVGSGQSAIRSFATKLYWLEATPELGLARVLARDGAAFESRIKAWQKREAEHFAKERTREYADFIISTA